MSIFKFAFFSNMQGLTLHDIQLQSMENLNREDQLVRIVCMRSHITRHMTALPRTGVVSRAL